MYNVIKAFLLSTVLMILVSCGGKSATNKKLQEKTEQLEKYKKQQAELNADIKKLEAEIAQLDPANAQKEQAKLVVLDTVELQKFTHYIELQGRIEADNVSFVSPRGGGGQVRAVYVKEGEYVRKGQLLLKLDDAIVRQSVAAARQAMGATRNQLELARSVYQRTKNLWDQKIGTEIQLLQAKTNVEVLENQLRTQQANVRTAEEQLATTNVISNVSGVAEQVNVHPGESFMGGPNGIVIVNNSNLKAVTSIPENYLSRVSKGTPVIVTVQDINKTYNTSISLISQAVNTTTAGFIAEAKIPADKSLKTNLTATFKIQDYNVPNAATIPVNIIQTDEQGKFVLVAVREGKNMVARKRQVQVGELYGNQLEVKTGLKAGDVIIAEGFQGLYDGQVITTNA